MRRRSDPGIVARTREKRACLSTLLSRRDIAVCEFEVAIEDEKLCERKREEDGVTRLRKK